MRITICLKMSRGNCSDYAFPMKRKFLPLAVSYILQTTKEIELKLKSFTHTSDYSYLF